MTLKKGVQSSNQIGVLELILTDEQGVSYANSGFENTDYTLVTLHPQRPTPLKFSEETSLPPSPLHLKNCCTGENDSK